MFEIAGLAISAIALFLSFYFAIYRAGRNQGELISNLNSIDTRVKVLENGQSDIQKLQDICTRLSTQIEPFWALLEKQVVGIIHSPHTPELDYLLDNLYNLNSNELSQLKSLLNDELILNKTAGNLGKSVAIALLIARLNMKNTYNTYN